MQTFTMKRVLLVAGVSAAICLSFTFSTLASTNFVTNPGFELSTTPANGGWSAFGGAVLNSTGRVRTGTKAIRCRQEMASEPSKRLATQPSRQACSLN